jgi:hypothetical protein
MDFLDQGMNGRIYDLGETVKKIQKRKSMGHDIITQKRLHHLTERLIDELNLKTLRVPHVFMKNPNEYEMSKVNTDKIIYPGNPNHGYPADPELLEKISKELTILWLELYKSGFAAWDFELFLQPDGSVVLLDFDKFGFRMTSGPVSILMPSSRHGDNPFNLEYFFINPCFPHDFVDRLRASAFEPPADCLPTRKN